MIYELHGKIPQNSSFVYSEDVLTSTITIFSLENKPIEKDFCLEIWALNILN
ncbi:hypothetical protein [Treponema porcinum]|uniref:hypothetical protein n=1 Tax=Treponema porcinum TaxID=261392 RepID=UPI0023579960|nr:hypothetical protein [Treponema porcinum]MCI6481431.1 hypothetical protein [Treponema porcinum]